VTSLRQKSILELREDFDSDSGRRLELTLRKTWLATMGTTPGELEPDLEAMRGWFDPVAQGQRLRRRLSELAVLPTEIDDPGPPLTYVVGPGKRLVTPEGRCLMDLLEHHSDRSRGSVSDADLVPYDRLLARLYREWSRHRIRSVVDLLGGSTKPLQIPCAGVVIALLVNRSTSKARALDRSVSALDKDTLSQVLFGPVQAFADVLAPSRRRNRANRAFLGGWMLSEARRRLGDALVLLDTRDGAGRAVWVRAESERSVIDIVSRDLARGHRAPCTPDRFAEAYDALVTNLRVQRHGRTYQHTIYERPLESLQLRERLIEALVKNLKEPRNTRSRGG
jgi:hypothetical protein